MSGRMAATTPGWLLRAAGGVVALAVVAAVVVLWAAGSIGDAARTIGRDAEPSVALALGMTSTLASMNAAAISDALTDDGRAAGTSAAFRDGTIRLGQDLVEASRNITYGEREAGPLRDLQQALFGYQEAVAESRYIGAGDAWITSRRVQWASRVNRDFAAPAAQALAEANAAVLEDRWAAYQSRWLLGAAAGTAALALLAGLLVVIQLWLARRMRRVINPPLALATALCAAAALWFGSAAFAAHTTLRGAKLDAYDSLHVLFEAKAAVNAIRADASLWLLDPTVRTEAQARIDGSAEALIGPASHDPAQARLLATGLQTALATEQSGDKQRALAQTPKTAGLLGTELGNITFGMAERQAASDSVARLLDVGQLVRSVQSQAAQDRPAAVARWLSERSGGGGPIFAAVQTALDRTIAVNQSAFDTDTAAVLSSDRLIAPVTLAALVAVALLSVGGLWLRLREYR